jgi:hypothetical protein
MRSFIPNIEGIESAVGEEEYLPTSPGSLLCEQFLSTRDHSQQIQARRSTSDFLGCKGQGPGLLLDKRPQRLQDLHGARLAAPGLLHPTLPTTAVPIPGDADDG